MRPHHYFGYLEGNSDPRTHDHDAWTLIKFAFRRVPFSPAEFLSGRGWNLLSDLAKAQNILILRQITATDVCCTVSVVSGEDSLHHAHDCRHI
jgi:hypothetical protein